jgi:hypothetical protein
MFAMAAGLAAVSLLSGLHNDIWALLHPSEQMPSPLWKPVWLPAVEFPWRIFFGASVTFIVGLSFRASREASANASAPETTSIVN